MVARSFWSPPSARAFGERGPKQEQWDQERREQAGNGGVGRRSALSASPTEIRGTLDRLGVGPFVRRPLRYVEYTRNEYEAQRRRGGQPSKYRRWAVHDAEDFYRELLAADYASSSSDYASSEYAPSSSSSSSTSSADDCVDCSSADSSSF